MDILQCHGIVLSSMVYKEADKLVTLLTAENGIMQAVVKGAIKTKSKQAYLAQPFCFAQFEYVQKQGFATITGATDVQLFPELMQDLQVYVYATMVLEVAKIIGLENVPQPQLFVQVITTIVNLAKQKDTLACIIAFLYKVLELAGYAVQIQPTKGAEKYMFHYQNGEVVASNQGNLSREQVMFLAGYKAEPSVEQMQELFRMLIRYFEEKTNTKLKSLQGYDVV